MAATARSGSSGTPHASASGSPGPRGWTSWGGSRPGHLRLVSAGSYWLHRGSYGTWRWIDGSWEAIHDPQTQIREIPLVLAQGRSAHRTPPEPRHLRLA